MLQVITSSVSRIAAAAEPDSSDETCDAEHFEILVLIILVALAGFFLVAALAMYYLLLQKYLAKDYKRLSIHDTPDSSLTRNQALIVDDENTHS